MPRTITRTKRGPIRAVTYLTAYTKQDGPSEEELVIPENLSELGDEELASLHEQALAAFNDIYGDGSGQFSEEDMATMNGIADGLESLNTELESRAAAAQERSDQAATLASRVLPGSDTDEAEEAEEGDAETEEASDDTDTEAEGSTEAGADPAVEGAQADQPDAVAAGAGTGAGTGGRKEVRVNLAGLRSRQAQQTRTPRPASEAATMADIATAAPDMPGFANGEGLDWTGIGKGIDRRLMGFNKSQYARAAEAGRHLRQQFGVAVLHRPFTEDLTISSDDPGHVDTVLHRAMDETRLPQGSLVASGGWCAPSETVYDLCALESTDGLISLPEIGISRGGIRFAQGPNFADIYNDTGFCYTEAEDEAGDYDGSGGGSKPCYKVDCPPFVDERLNLCGTCISAGLLQSRGYPEMIARTTSGAMIAHSHRVSANVIQAMVAGSDSYTIPAPQAGATAPVLTAIELQVESVKYANRMSRGASLEAVFPYWVRGVVRADLARRLGVDLISVPDSRIDGWFRERGINPQYVYDWQDLATEAPSGTAWPESVDFLLYPAGTWVKGTSDVISLDTVYDSTMLGTNDYTALFFEEGWLAAKMCHDSRLVTVPVCGDGATHGGVDIACDGTEGS